MAGFGKDRWPADGAVRALLEYLDELHRGQGQPSYARMGREVGLAPSTLAPFFTGTRLIGAGNLELLVQHLDGDTARAERLRKRAAVEWSVRPAPATAPVPAQAGPGAPGPAGNRPLSLFRAGCGVGSAVTLQRTESGLFEEFLAALRVIGLEEAETAPLRGIRARLEQTGEAEEAGLAVLTAFSGVLAEVIALVEERTSRAEFRWFLLGKSLQGIALVAAGEWPSAPEIEGARTELFYLSDAVDMPQGLRAEVKGYSRTELPTAGRMDMVEEAARLSRAFHAVL
ncbi:hypothetical protein [Kitasatospora sp. NPDC056181]|uniref:hypothetical protein n=1 Tax=Kitasatospora sp. NPDC056181 TaxID=3345737 RepID=UPI0035D6613D